MFTFGLARSLGRGHQIALAAQSASRLRTAAQKSRARTAAPLGRRRRAAEARGEQRRLAFDLGPTANVALPHRHRPRTPPAAPAPCSTTPGAAASAGCAGASDCWRARRRRRGWWWRVETTGSPWRSRLLHSSTATSKRDAPSASNSSGDSRAGTGTPRWETCTARCIATRNSRLLSIPSPSMSARRQSAASDSIGSCEPRNTRRAVRPSTKPRLLCSALHMAS